MHSSVNLREIPSAAETVMIVGWRQWADAGSVSSALPVWLVEQLGARKIGDLRPDGFYLFQIPGTHDLVRPSVRIQDGYPEALGARRNEFFYSGNERRGLVIFLGDEPHLDVERYTAALLDAARALGVRRVISLGGVYGELPYDKERPVTAVYSLPHLRDELTGYAVSFSNYQGGASIGSYLCKRAEAAALEWVGFYAFVPMYDFSRVEGLAQNVRLESDFVAWHGVMRRVVHMLGLTVDLGDLAQRSERLIQHLDERAAELDRLNPELGVRDYLARLSDNFEETPFYPLDDVWERELRNLFERDEE